ncbi:MAG: hypothetical protein ABWY25_00645 [Paenisporosarcina sp.]
MKGIVITQSNQQLLMSRYMVNVFDTDMFPIGYIMITDFGDNGERRYEGVITQELFDSLYVRGEDLKNDFFAIVKK